MFNMDIVALREFYASAIGRMVALVLLRAIRRAWPDCAGDELATLGFVLPLLESFVRDCKQIIPMMPGYQGAMAWPSVGGNRMMLVNERALPLKSESVNRVLVLHTLENSRASGKMLEELWRVLVPGGRALVLVPNRRGLWSQAATTPFGCGQPYTLHQIGKRLGAKRFTIASYRTCLFTPPVGRRWFLRLSPVLEWLGDLLLPESGGVIMMEVEKQIYASIPEPVTEIEDEKYLIPAMG